MPQTSQIVIGPGGPALQSLTSGQMGPQPMPQFGPHLNPNTPPVTQPTASQQAPAAQQVAPQQAVVTSGQAEQQVQGADQLMQQILQQMQVVQQTADALAERQRQEQQAARDTQMPVLSDVERRAQDLQEMGLDNLRLTNNEIDQFNQFMEQRKLMSDELHAAQISQIQATYDRLRRMEIEQTEARVGALEVLGIRSGRARYAGEIHQSILSAEQTRSMQRLSDLEVEEQGLILQAQQAKSAEDWEAFVQTMNFVQNARQERMQIVQNMFENAIAAENQAIARAREQRSVADDLIGMMVQGGVMPSDQEISRLASMKGVSPDLMRGVLENMQASQLAENDKQYLDSLKRTADILKAFPAGTEIPMPDGSVMVATGSAGDIHVSTITDRDGNVRQISTNKLTGQQSVRGLGQIGKPSAVSGGFSFNRTDQAALVAVGLTEPMINAIEQDIRLHGAPRVMDNIMNPAPESSLAKMTEQERREMANRINDVLERGLNPGFNLTLGNIDIQSLINEELSK